MTSIVEVIHSWPAVETLVATFSYLAVKAMVARPLTIATLVAVLGTKKRRAEARRVIFLLVQTREQTETSQPQGSKIRNRPATASH